MLILKTKTNFLLTMKQTKTMKNIHVLPTDKPSRLFVTDGKLFNYHKPQKGDGIKIINQNIYITSDEPAYPYALHLKKREVFKTRAVGSNSLELYHDKGFSYPEECKKIILTTDQDFIGVQAIDDDFLEWFVKNPSCEFVEVKRSYMMYDDETKDGIYNKIIIPKEIGFKVENGKRTETFYSKQEPTIEEEYLKDELKKYDSIDVVVLNKPEESKQETLEEVAERYYEDEVSINAFVNGAKWQQEQDKNKFSEEDMKIAFLTNSNHLGTFEEFIELFKNK